MSILTGLVIVVAMATLAQRSDQLANFLFGEKEASIAPQNDSFAILAGESQIIDVLANDTNAKAEDASNIHILVSPSCGAAEAADGGVLYISNDRCVGAQLFAYCVRRGDECASASVTVNVSSDVAGLGATPRQSQPVQSQPAQSQPVQPEASQPVRTQPQPQVETTQIARAPEPEAVRAPVQTTNGSDATPSDANRAPQAREVVTAIRTVEPARAAPLLRTPVPVIDDGGRAPVTQAEAEPKEEAGIFQRLFFAPSDEPEPSDSTVPDAPPRVAGLGGTEQWRPGSAPDVSQIAGGEADVETEIRIAAVQTDDAAPSRERAQEVEAQNLPAAPAATAAPASAGSCAAEFSTRPGQGGMVRIELQADCYASRPFVLLHAGLEFGAWFDANGAAEMEIPVLEITSDISVRFEDGSSATTPLNIDVRSVEQTRRVAIAWTAPVNLDLHAFEYSAGFGADGHVWEQNPRDFRVVRRPGGGFHSSFPAAVNNGQSIEVYTFWANRRARPGFMRIVVDHASRGEVANGEFCGQGPLASPGYTVLRSESGVVTDRSQSGFTPANCGQSIGVDVRYSNGALADLQISE